MNDIANNNKRIAQNTLLLYMRMLFLMLISLYTSRVILNSLGVEDYGIYNVVGGVVTMFSVLSGSLNAAISRFITFELGKGETGELNKVFSSSVTIQIGISIIFILVAETLGLWFLNYKMVIPDGRMVAANWCFQFSIITFAINLISVPYNAAIVAHEKMSAFAYISILEGVGKLIIALCISFNPFDRLVFFALMVAILAWIVRILYTRYCKKHFDECSYHFIYDHKLLKKMFSFAGWNFFGAGSWQLMTQGVNLVLNLFWGVTVNAARGIASQVDNAVLQFVNNFTTAINPQITKSYAANEKEYMFSLMFRGAKFSYFLVLFFAVPIICETRLILEVWLKTVPEYTVSFVRLALIASMIHVLSNTMITAMLATGNIKKYQLIVGGIGMLVLPLALLFFYLGLPPQMAYISTILVFITQLICRLFLMRELISMSITRYIREVLLKALLTTLVTFSLPIVICILFEESFARFLIVGFTSVILCTLSVYFIGLTTSEQQFVFQQIKSKVNKHRKNVV